MSDRVAVMNKGRIEQLAEPRELYLRPASLFALNFVGLSTRISGTVLSADNGKVDVETRVGRLSALGNFQAGSSVIVAARPEQLRIGGGGETNSASGRVRSVVFQGSRTLVEVDAGAGESLLAELSGRDGAIPVLHDEIRLSWPVTETFAFPMEAQA
jgi:putative spermidine/putrescine transport system ATP-binding protein